MLGKIISGILSVVSFISFFLIIFQGQSVEEYIHNRYFSDNSQQQIVLRINENTGEKITNLSVDDTNAEIKDFSNISAIDNYKTPVGKQIWNVAKVIVLIIFVSSMCWLICTLLGINKQDIGFRYFIIPAIILILFTCIYNIFFLKYEFTVNNQSIIESIEYTDNSYENVKITSYTGDNYITTECSVKSLLAKKYDSSLLVAYNYAPKSVFGYIMEWKARASKINVLYLDDAHYSDDMNKVIDSFSAEGASTQDIEVVKKDIVSYMENSNLSFSGDHWFGATLLKLIIIIGIITVIILLCKQGDIIKNIGIALSIVVVIVGIIPVVITFVKGVKYEYNIDNIYPVMDIYYEENNNKVYDIKYTINGIEEEISIDSTDTQIVQMSDTENATQLYKCKKKVSNIYSWFAEIVSKSRTFYVIK